MARTRSPAIGRYAADLTLTGMAHAKFRYADHPHARILSIDTSKARALDGVFAVITQDDVPDVRHGAFIQDRTLFARDVVRYEGDVIAAVAALTPEIAERAAELIDIEYEVLPAVGHQDAALEPGAPQIHPDWESYEGSEDVVREGNICSRSTIVKGDADAAMEKADIVVSERYEADMSHAVPIEPHAVVAQWQGDKVTIWSSTQVPFIARSRGRDHARDPRVARSRDRALPGRRVRREVRVPFRGAHRGAVARRQAARCGWCSAARRSSWRPTTAARASRSTSRPA